VPYSFLLAIARSIVLVIPNVIFISNSYGFLMKSRDSLLAIVDTEHPSSGDNRNVLTMTATTISVTTPSVGGHCANLPPPSRSRYTGRKREREREREREKERKRERERGKLLGNWVIRKKTRRKHCSVVCTRQETLDSVLLRAIHHRDVFSEIPPAIRYPICACERHVSTSLSTKQFANAYLIPTNTHPTKIQ